MKHIKVTFLFFMMLFFVFCKKEFTRENNSFKKKTEVENFIPVDFSNYSNLTYQEQLELSKKILKQAAISKADMYLVFNTNSFVYSKLNKLDSAIYYQKAMLNMDLTKKNDTLLGKINFRLGTYFHKKNQVDSAFYYYNKSKEHLFNTNDSLQLGKCLLNMAYIEKNFGNYTKSDSIATASIKFINGKRASTTASAYNVLAINSKKRFLYKDAISYYTTSIGISNRKSSNITYKNNLANVYKELKNYSKSISILEDLLKDSISNLKTKARVIDNLAHVKWINNSKEPVLKDFLLAKSIRIQEKDTYALIASYSHLSEFFYKKDKTKSLLYANKMYEISKQEKSPQDQIEAIEKIIALKTPQKSIKYYKEGIRLRDSLQKAETKRQYKFANIKYNYELEEKQKLKFKNLASENKFIAEQANSQKKNIVLISIILASGLLFLIFIRKQQHKKRILQETYNTETRIAKRLHDELGNDIFNTLTKIQSTKFKTEEIINDLDKIYLQTRGISHENDSIETGNNFENYFRDLIASYNFDACKIILKDLSSLDLNTLNKEKQIVFYRVFNELFVNMRKHSNATLVVISCKKINNRLEVVYADNGVGFKDKKIIFKNGLKNMGNRINTINGSINFENRANNGLKVVLSFKK